MSREFLAERIWRGEDMLSFAARSILAPLSLAYQTGISGRNALYDDGILRSHTPAIPAISVGNLSVGGTGKTPVSSWIAAQLRDRGAHPVIVLRGYGDDEPIVHRRLQPDVPVIVSPDRLRGIAEAAAQGADIAVMDDAFQHRRVRRIADVVLISADDWTERQRLLPAGPWREPLSAVKRATLIVITRKAATDNASDSIRAATHAVVRGLPIAMLDLRIENVVREDGSDRMPVGDLRDSKVLAIAAIADTRAFVRQLEGTGALVRASLFPDHYPFNHADAARLVASLSAGERAICTLKDAVKLAPLWPRAASPLWYVSQRVTPVGRGELFDALFDAVLAVRATFQSQHHGPAESRHGD